MTNQMAAKRVAKGAAWLDEIAPGWEHKLSFQNLDMSSGCKCVLGQVFFEEASDTSDHRDNYLSWVEGEGFVPNGFSWAFTQYHELLSDRNGDEDLGFDHGGGITYEQLRDAWEALVKERFDNGTLSG